MGHEVDEDLIEATIRRVAEAQAARGGAPEPADAQDDAPPEAADEEAAPEPSFDVPVAPQPQFDTPAAAPDASAPYVAEDEDPIEATIRRVAAERAARDAELAAAATTHDSDPVDDAIAHAEAAVAPEPVEEYAAPALHIVPSIEPEDAAAIDESPALDDSPAYRRPRVVEPESWVAVGHSSDEAVARLESGLRDAVRRIDVLTERVDALMAAIERASAPASAAATPAQPHVAPVPSPAAGDDDDWDDAPQLPRIPMGGPPRPAILRDPSPMTATAEHLVEDAPAAIEPPTVTPRPAPQAVAPAPAPAPAAPEPRRGFDLLPKTYRITVEDKRRGVDLVPLHRALLGMDGVKDMSLLSYSNGVAIVAVETLHGIDPDALNRSVARAMAREVKVEVHNETTMVVKVAED